jgi:hypothetical protein
MGVLDPSSEVLVGGADDGSYYRINTASGAVTPLGQLSQGWVFDGDLVSIAGVGTYATLHRMSDYGDFDPTTYLVQFDLRTGAVSQIGDTGFNGIWGIGYWRSTIYGFTQHGQFVSINAQTGQGTLISQPAQEFWGAGSTTVAPVTPL